MATTGRMLGGRALERRQLWMLAVAMLLAACCGVHLMAQGAGSAAQDNAWRDEPPRSTGIAIGEKIPAFSVPDQSGTAQTFESIKGPNGAAIYFSRSVDWWPYCKSQLVELQRYAEDFRRRGLGLAVITYDTVAIAADFAKRHNITVPILADAQSKAIRDFGVLNTAVPEGHMWEGVPYPGTFVVDGNGVVKSKYFEDTYQDRYAAPTILLREYGSVAGTRETTVNAKYLQMKYYSTTDLARPDLRLTLVADFVLPPKMHVYTPEVKGYIPIDFKLDDSPYYVSKGAEYPEGEMLMLPAIDEIVPVYHGSFRITQDVVLSPSSAMEALLEGDKTLKISGSLRYQACDDKICYLPETLPMEWTLQLEGLERARVPEAIRH